MPPRKQINYPYCVKNDYGKVVIYKQKNRDWWTFVVTWKLGKNRKRECFSDERVALKRAEEILADYKEGAGARSDLTLDKLVYFRECERRLGDTPLHVAVEFYLAHHIKVDRSKMTDSVVEEYLALMDGSSRSRRYKQTLRHHLNLFAAAFKKPLLLITATEIDQYLSKVSETERTKHNHRNSICSLFHWAQNKEYIPHGQLTAAQRSTPIRVVREDPEIFTPDELEKILNSADLEIVPMIAIGAFAGPRTAEIQRLRWENINWDEKLIALPRSITKKNQRRTAIIRPNLLKWLEPFKEKTGPLVPTSKPHEKLREAAKSAGLSWEDNGETRYWKDNALRHSCISYLMAIERNAAVVAEQCGNSESEVQNSYKALVTKSDAEKWYSLEPREARFKNPTQHNEHPKEDR